MTLTLTNHILAWRHWQGPLGLPPQPELPAALRGGGVNLSALLI